MAQYRRGNRPGEAEDSRPLPAKQKPVQKPVAKKPAPRPQPDVLRPVKKPQPSTATVVTGAGGGNTPKPLPRKNPVPPVLHRPAGLTPPASTGPIINPQGELRARVAGSWGLSDEARRGLSHTRIRYDAAESTPDDFAGAYFPDSQDIQINQLNEAPYISSGTLAHEYAHKRWRENLMADESPDTQKEFLRDTAYASRDNPGITYSTQNWEAEAPLYNTPDNPTRRYDLDVYPTELNARVMTYARRMPEYYREKWFPGMFAPTPPWRSSSEDGPPDRTYNTTWGQFPVWR